MDARARFRMPIQVGRASDHRAALLLDAGWPFGRVLHAPWLSVPLGDDTMRFENVRLLWS